MATKTTTRKKKAPAQNTTNWEFIHKILDCPTVRTVYMYGPPGIGKTYSAYRYGRLDNGVYPITVTQDTPASELRGHYVPRSDSLEWHDGPFTAAMRSGARLVVNELSHASPDVQALLYPVLESVETAQLMLPTNETVRPAEGFHVICTDNEAPDGLPEALQDRFDSTIEVNQPHPEALSRLAEPLRRAATRCFSLDEDRRVTLRGWFAVDRLRDLFGLEEACIAVFGANRGVQIFEAIQLAE